MEEEHSVMESISNENYLSRAESGKRVANYIIDLIVFYLLLLGIGMVIGIFSSDALRSIPDSKGFGLLDRILTLVFYAFYMSIVEAIFQGKSLGQVITGTRAVNLDGSRISATTAFARGFSRAVPFCVFSAFGSPCIPWQDSWTNTIVIDEKNSTINSKFQEL